MEVALTVAVYIFCGLMVIAGINMTAMTIDFFRNTK